MTERPPRDDRELVRDCLRGDEAAWDELLGRYRRLIYSIPVKCGLSAADAADIFQIVCIRLLEKLDELRDHTKLASWISTTTARECWRVKAGPIREMMALDDPASDLRGLPQVFGLPEDTFQKMEEQHLIRMAVQALPERCRKLLTLLFYEKEDWTYEAIAEEMEMPVASIGPNRARCLEKLKIHLKRLGVIGGEER